MSAQSFENYPTPEETLLQPVLDANGQFSVVPHPEDHTQPTTYPEDDERALRLEAQRQQMLHDFYDFSKETHDIDPLTSDVKLEHDLALVIHGYAWSRANQHIEKTRQRATDDPTYTAPDIRLLDYEKINGRVNYHYRQFGEDRSVINRINRREEETFLISAKRRATAFIYDDNESGNDHTNGGKYEGRRGIPRQRRYPEIMLVMELREALINDRAYVSAKGAEITFAAYGSIFPALVRERAIDALNEAGMTRRIIKKIWAEQELPADELPDKILPRKPKP